MNSVYPNEEALQLHQPNGHNASKNSLSRTNRPRIDNDSNIKLDPIPEFHEARMRNPTAEARDPSTLEESIPDPTPKDHELQTTDTFRNLSNKEESSKKFSALQIGKIDLENPPSWKKTLFEYTTASEKGWMIIAFLCSTIHGAIFPLLNWILGSATEKMSPINPPEDIYNLTSEISLLALHFANGVLVVSTLGTFIWNYIGKIVELRVRKKLFRSLIKQDISWYDTTEPEKLTNSYLEDTSAFLDCKGEKNHSLVYSTSLVIFSFVLGLAKGLAFAGVVTACLPIVVFGVIMATVAMMRAAASHKLNFGKAAACSEQAFLGMKTLTSLNGQEHEVAIYDHHVENSRKGNVKSGYFIGFSYGLIFSALFLIYTVGWYVAGRFIEGKVHNLNTGNKYSTSDIITIFFSMLTGVFSIAQIQPALDSISKGRLAAGIIFRVVENKPSIESDSVTKIASLSGGMMGDSQRETTNLYSVLKGEIHFKQVSFNYPSRPNVPVLVNFDLRIQPGQKIALVGETGSGKSTFVGLLERFYDPDQGQILIDGSDIKNYNLKDLRKFVGYVGQEPV
jgi:ATP-binding cassette subfamily B (MDR/TAP) protein 1